MHPATSPHAALMKSDIRILTGLSHSISGFGKNSILTSLVGTMDIQKGLAALHWLSSSNTSVHILEMVQGLDKVTTLDNQCCRWRVKFHRLASAVI